MDTGTKTPVAIVQEFIALHTTRKEAAERLNAQPTAARQSDTFISELMNELSNYGDAVMASVDRENEYQQIWKAALGTVDTITPEQGAQTFQQMEDSLKTMYQHTLETGTELPEALREILSKQAGQL